MVKEKIYRVFKLGREKIDIFNEKNEPLETQRSMLSAHLFNMWHRSAHIWIYNSKGELLLQRRSEEMSTFPGKWDLSAAGHLDAGESPEQGALRELKEEIGIKAKKEDLEFSKVKKISQDLKFLGVPTKNNEFCYIYLTAYTGDVSELKMQESEVDNLKFFDLQELKRMLKRKEEKFVPHGDYWFEVIGEIRKRVG